MGQSYTLGTPPSTTKTLCTVVLFQWPTLDEEAQEALQDKFLGDGEFWRPWLGQLRLWTKPVGVTVTEAPDGQPAFALLLEFCETEEIVHQAAHGISEALQLPAYGITVTEIDGAMLQELKREAQPWRTSGEVPASV